MRPNLSDVPYLPSRLQDLDEIPRDLTCNTVVDLGCGTGEPLQWFAQYYPRAHLQGVEWDAQRAEICRQKLPQSEITTGDFWRFDLTKADVVYLYWTDNVIPGFMEVHWPQLKPGAVVISNNYPLPGLVPLEDRTHLFIYKK